MMDRRKFIGGLVASAAVRTWPFRVFSFPQEIKLPNLWTLENASQIRFMRFDPQSISRIDVLTAWAMANMQCEVSRAWTMLNLHCEIQR